MPNLLLTVFIILTSSAYALELTVLDPCSGEALIQKEIGQKFENVGQLTVKHLSQSAVNFVGSELGVNTMFGTPTGEAALEIISRREMRSYGWCYSVDGKLPEVYPSHFPLDDSVQSIEWFFGFAFYDSGVWKTQCEPLHLAPKEFICH